MNEILVGNSVLFWYFLLLKTLPHALMELVPWNKVESTLESADFTCTFYFLFFYLANLSI